MINQINAFYPDGPSIPLILKLYLKRKGIIANSLSNTPHKGDTERVLSLLESRIGELEQKGALPGWDLNLEIPKVLNYTFRIIYCEYKKASYGKILAVKS